MNDEFHLFFGFLHDVIVVWEEKIDFRLREFAFNVGFSIFLLWNYG